jgi:histidine kinase
VNRLVVRLVISHVAVAVVAAIATFLVVRQLAPALFDASLRMGPGGSSGQGPGATPGTVGGAGMLLRQQFGDAVDQALVVGAVVGVLTAALVGAVAAYRLTRPLEALRAATRAMAQGTYAVPLPTSRTTELAELTTDVRRLGQQLGETETRRVQLLGEVAHEMRTPLTVIDGTVEAMIDGVLPLEPDQLAVLSDEVRRLRRLSDDLSALSRADEGRLSLVVTEVDLRRVVTQAAERLRAQAEDAGLDFDVDALGEPMPMHVDAERIGQVVTNLVGNAIRATPEGGRVRVRCGRAHSGGHPGSTPAVIVVEDSGEGLAAADVERIFERFYRVPGRRATQHETGSGIGLTIARGIVAAHGGQIAATSDGPGLGAIFTVTLPSAHDRGAL